MDNEADFVALSFVRSSANVRSCASQTSARAFRGGQDKKKRTPRVVFVFVCRRAFANTKTRLCASEYEPCLSKEREIAQIAYLDRAVRNLDKGLAGRPLVISKIER